MTYETIITKEIEEPFLINDFACMFKFLTSNYKARDEEQVILMTLGEQLHLIKSHVVYIGNASKTAVDARDVMYKAITDKAKHIIIAYIRSSNTDLLRPRDEDYANAGRIYRAAKIMGFKVISQIIISGNGYTTFKHDHNSPNDMIDD
jgi:DNA repair protein RadC